MLSQRIMWTVLPVPNSIPSPHLLRLAVVISPRLWTDEQLPRPQLRMFSDFEDWPATLRDITWLVRIGDTEHAARATTAARSELWTGLFAATTFVRPATFTDFTGEKIRSYPAGGIASFLLDRYAAVAADSPTAYPTVDWLSGPDGLGPITFDPDSLALADEKVERLLREHRAVPPGPPDPPVDFHQLRRFLQPRGRTLVDVDPLDADFHDVVAMIADHPALQRQLGLVVDLSLPLDVLEKAEREPLLSVVPQWAPTTTGECVDQTPGLRCVVDSGWLRAAEPRSGLPLREGKVVMRENLFQVIQIDHDGAAVKAVGLAHQLAQAAQDPAVGEPDRQPLPALRSAGFALAHRGRAATLVWALARSRDLYDRTHAGHRSELDGGDLVRGYRVDVLHVESAQWYSLHARAGRYELPSGKGLNAKDEGTLIATPTSAADGSSGDLFHQETMFQWMGWSLAVRRPGTALSPQELIDPNPASRTAPAYPLDIRFDVLPRSLPRLRFGSHYAFRLRAVDIAGNSVRLTTASAENLDLMTRPVVYGRYEPVPVPRLTARQPLTQNEDIDRLVIRSNFDSQATGEAQRHVLPTAGAQLLAEHHGRLDTPRRGLDRGVWSALVRREGARLEDLPSARPDPGRPAETYHDVDRLDVPYLPDPLCRGAALTGLPGAARPLKVSFSVSPDAPWYETHSFRVVLEEGAPASAVLDDRTRELRVSLPKGTVLTTRLSSYVHDDDLAEIGIWHLLETHPGADLDQLRQVVTEGSHWMITPHRMLTFVHAVRQPLDPPRFATLDPMRGPGATYADYRAPTHLHRASTARIDVVAQWTEPTDAGPGGPEPSVRAFRSTAFSHPVVGDDGTPQADLVVGRHEFGDTRHRKVAYTAVGTSRFLDYFARREQIRLSGTTPHTLDEAGLLRDSVTVSIEDGSYEEDRDYVLDLVRGTIARTDPSGMPSGQLVTVRYTPLPVTREATAPTVVQVPSTARPPAPAARYAVPSFAWTRNRTGDVTLSRRTGSGFRVYLERPWHVSGEGEVLGVVVERDPQTPKPSAVRAKLRDLTTLLAEDPVYRTGGTPPPALTTVSFPEAGVLGTELLLEGVPEPVDVAGHSVVFDSARGLWFCDIPVAHAYGYTPLIRPALVRYQPHSLPGLHLSPVRLLDYLPLLPDRETRVERSSPRTYEIRVTGPGYRATAAGMATTRFVVTAERQDPRVPGELGWSAAQAGVDLHSTEPEEPDGLTVWSGRVKLPGGTESDLAHWRLLVEEFEQLNSATTDDTPTVSDRLVFLDTIPLAP
ncbi:hypothetical protein ACFQ6E_38190 [Streptomyces sp. NPDC056462]|uniref:hypothetical protein n=1 Tax=Streptomyces sp. NPDC056462 TaxID=3345826 RepID=UPI0036C54487